MYICEQVKKRKKEEDWLPVRSLFFLAFFIFYLTQHFITFLFPPFPPPYCCLSMTKRKAALDATGRDNNKRQQHVRQSELFTFVGGLYDAYHTSDPCRASFDQSRDGY